MEAGAGTIQTGGADADSRRDLHRLARGGLLNLAGAISNGAFGILLVVVVARGLPRGRAGLFFEAVALFTILVNVSHFGADDGLVRMVARLRALRRVGDLRRTIAVGLWPVAAAAVGLGVGLFATAPALSRLLLHGRTVPPGAMTPLLRAMAPFLLPAAVATAMLSATRGFGTMIPSVVLDNVLEPAVRPLAALAVLAAGLGGVALALAWAAPAALELAAAAAWLWLLVARIERAGAGAEGVPVSRSSTRTLAGEFWRFAAPRGLSATFGITVAWLDVLLVGALRGPGDSAVYVAAGRYLAVGLIALSAVQGAAAPLVSAALATGRQDRAQAVYQAATGWLIAAAWPAYLTLAVYAPLFLRLFGPGYQSGQGVLLTLSVSMLAAMASGPVLVVLLMGGRSGWTLAVAALSLGLNVVLNLLLIPRLGIEGAALAWAASIVFNNGAGVVLVGRLLGLQPFSAGFAVAAVAAIACFGAVGVAVRAWLGASASSFALYWALAVPLYAFLLWRFRRILDLAVLGRAVSNRAAGVT